MEPIPAMLIFFPALTAVGHQMGLDPVHLGLVMVLNLMIGMATPPVGFLLLVVSAIGDAKMGHLVREVFPFLIICWIVLFACSIFPPLATWLPGLMP